MKKILVTGSSGFIGSHLVKKLREQGHFVEGYDYTYNDQWYDYNVSNGPNETSNILNIGPTFLDETDEHFDVIFHLAAYVSASKSIEYPWICNLYNIGGTNNVAQLASDKSRMVFASSAAVYGDQTKWVDGLRQRSGFSEEEVSLLGDLKTPYAKSKLMGEEIVKDTCSNYANLRFFNVYGKGQNPAYGAVIQSFIDDYKSRRASTIFGDGQQTRDFVHVDDVVDALILAGDSTENFTANVGTGVGTTVEKLCGMISRDHEYIKYEPARGGDPVYSVADNKKLVDMGWSAKVDLKTALDRMKLC